jgi:IS1 family transposase
MPAISTTRRWAFPPSTHKLQLDEKWSFVNKKEKNCVENKPADQRKGDQWDFVALDPDSRLVLSAVLGKRTQENARKLLEDVKRRLGGRTPELLTSDDLSSYEAVIVEVFGREVIPERTGKPGRPRNPYKEAPPELNYATVNKTRAKGRVTEVATRVVLGTAAVAALLGAGQISTSYVERQHATDRHRNARKARKTYRFSKEFSAHEALTYFTLYSYNFCWPVRTLRQRDPQGHWQRRTPAMAAGLADHVWSLREWLAFPACQRS